MKCAKNDCQNDAWQHNNYCTACLQKIKKASEEFIRKQGEIDVNLWMVAGIFLPIIIMAFLISIFMCLLILL